MSDALPIHAARAAFDRAIAQGPVVLSAPTGSGKSTEVPRWCAGPVLVIEPRRVACRSLAARVAQLEGTRLGDAVGYVVRDDRAAREDTRVVFATPGIALRDRAMVERARTIVIDEMHERSLEVDLLLALVLREARPDRSLVVMSATLDAERVAAHVGGAHVAAEGRAFPVDVRYLPGPSVLPDAADLAARVRHAIEVAASDPGDLLVFLPGKAEIDACARALSANRGLSIVPLHGGLSLDEQRLAFERTPQRKVILATNVAETSLTIPGVGVVIDSGLVRQTRYHEGRGFLALVPIAEDSAAQRAGRAGRTAAGVCHRLWSPAAKLAATTLPEIHRESLVPLVMGAAAWGTRPEDLPLLDAPKPHALDAARRDLEAWGALDGDSSLSEAGRGLHGLPVDPPHARLLVAARDHACLEDAIDLVAVLSVGRPLFTSAAGERADVDDPRTDGCDAIAFVRALRAERADDVGASPFVVHEARQARARLRRAFGFSGGAPSSDRAIDRDALVRAALAADARSAHVARTRGRDVFFGNGGTELELSRESAVRHSKSVEALVVLGTRALGTGRDARVLITCGMAIPLAAIARAGLGVERAGEVRVEAGRVIAVIERVHAGKVIATREDVPQGALARDAIATLLGRGSLFRDAVATSRERLTRLALAAQLAARGHPAGVPSTTPVSSIDVWLRARLDALGVESGDDLALLSAEDFLAPELDYEARVALDRELPATVSVGDAVYRAEYDLERGQVLLQMVKGSRREPPPLAYLPRFEGLRVCVAGPRGVSVLREKGR
ncbi:helicase-related protein [Sandaracinus amylolyticus]|uniref:helicase-related protein n=1 Tax=Sandaracinus amylolyticus TaxID=927083 RepID=UPI001F1A0833|nr:helicase-related protein [Sandaracinus amylolyticus]UJR84557.1 Hypothetical protein I5071_66360 [Sandaracinus amylolyticus]